MNTRLDYLMAFALLWVLAMSIGCASTRTVGEQIDDGVITSRITAKLAGDPEVSPFNVDVDTLDGVVTLRGEVEKEAAKQEAEKHARSTAGVLDVNNEIRVVSAEEEDDSTPSDAWITTRIKSKLAADPKLNPFNIDVDTLDSVVTLSGKVRSEAAREAVARIARNTKGVLDVDNRLQVVEASRGSDG